MGRIRRFLFALFACRLRTMKLDYRRITPSSADVAEVQTCFEKTFPPEERPPFEMTISWDNSSFMEIRWNGQFVGLVDVVECRDLLYVFFLAVEESFQDQGIGSQILTDLKVRYRGKRLFLLADEIDPKYPDIETRKRRFAFYARNGFKPSGVFILEFGVRYEMLIENDPVTKNEFVETMTFLIGEENAKKYYSNC